MPPGRYSQLVEIGNIIHKALCRFAETGNPRGLPPDLLDRIAKMLVFLEAAVSVEDLMVLPNYGAHLLKGDRAGMWSLTVSRNWRMTFKLNEEDVIIDLNLEDYH